MNHFLSTNQSRKQKAMTLVKRDQFNCMTESGLDQFIVCDSQGRRGAMTYDVVGNFLDGKAFALTLTEV